MVHPLRPLPQGVLHLPRRVGSAVRHRRLLPVELHHRQLLLAGLVLRHLQLQGAARRHLLHLRLHRHLRQCRRLWQVRQ